MIVAIDAMGGDSAPAVTVEGAVLAAREKLAEIILVGDQTQIGKELARHNIKGLPISIQHTSQIIEMHESPAQACRQKKDSSLMVCAKLVASGKADAYISAGNSGAAMAAALLHLKRIKGIARPAIASVLPTLTGKVLIVDVGANVDTKPEHLLQFAIMGSVYMEHIHGINKPKIGLLSIGEEKTKGNDLTLESFHLLDKTNLNFIGNIEGRDIPVGGVAVVVCDGFVGNVVLKLAEGIGAVVLSFLRDEIKKNFIRKLGYLLLSGAFSSIKKKIDYNEYGGSPLLGIDGDVIICHGSSNARAIKNAIEVAVEFVKHNLTTLIREEISSSDINVEEKQGGNVPQGNDMSQGGDMPQGEVE